MNSDKQKVFTGLFWKFGERITAQCISLLVSILLARLLSPTDYGAVALVLVFITLANVFVSNGFGSALIQKERADNLDFSSVFYISIGISVILYLIIFITAPLIADFYELPVMESALRVLGIRLIVAAVNTVQQAYVSRNMLFKKFFWSTLFGTVLSGIVGVIMAYQGFGVWALIAQYLTNTCTDTIVLWITVRWRPMLKCSLERAKGLLSYGWKLLVSALLDTGYTQLRNLIIGKIYTKEDLAFYNQGDKYPSLIVTNINASISSVLFPALSERQNEKDKLLAMTRRAIQVSSYVMWPLMVGLGVCAESLIKILLTEKWLPCVPYLRVFCFMYGLWPIHTANLQALNAMGRSDLFLKLEIIKKSAGILFLLASLHHGPFAIALSLVAVSIFNSFVNVWPNVKLLGYTYKMQLSDMLPPLIISALMGVMVYPLTLLELKNTVTFVVQVFTGIAIYLSLSIITKNPTFQYLYELLQKGKNAAKSRTLKRGIRS